MTWGGFSGKGFTPFQPPGGVENFYTTTKWDDFAAPAALTAGTTEGYKSLMDGAIFNAEILNKSAGEAAGIAADGKIFGSNMSLWGDLANTAGSFAGIGMAKGLFGGGGGDGFGVNDVGDYPITGRPNEWRDRISWL